MAVSNLRSLRVGARIANARGIPGTLGCLALTLDDRRLVFLTSHHVLFGAGAREQEPVWIAAENAQQSFRRAARSRHGRRGTVNHAGVEVYVDCATAELDEQSVPSGWRVTETAAGDVAALKPGDPVTKTGAATGTTHGIVENIQFCEKALIEGHSQQAQGQILVRPLTPGNAFTAEGDSGAALRNEDGAVVGLVWGVSASGDALACPIAPVLWLLNIRLARVVSSGAN